MISGLKLILFGALAIYVGQSSIEAKPYYFFQEAAPAPPAGPGPVNPANPDQSGISSEIQAQADPNHPLPQRITGHLGDLYSHGTSVVKSLAENVQPDIKNIGQDLTDVYHVTRKNVNERIRPLAQTMRPFIENAHKAVSPLMEQAKEEVPKALSKVADKARGAWEKFTSGGSQSLDQQAQQVGGQIQQAAGQVQQGAQNVVNQVDKGISAAQS